jgi:excisionase family DNA binding protein
MSKDQLQLATRSTREEETPEENTVPPDVVVPDKRNYTLKEAALFLNVSTRTVERLIERKLLRRNKALRKILIPRSELESFLENTL